MAVDTYYFNALHPTDSDPGVKWTDDANAVDGSTATKATTTTSGSDSASYVRGAGTTAPTSGGVITQVRVRVFSEDSAARTAGLWIYTASLAETLLNLGGVANNVSPSPPASPGDWSSYLTPTTPASGWSWSIVNALEFKYAKGALASTAGLYRVEIEVTSTPIVFDLASSNFYRKQGYQ